MRRLLFEGKPREAEVLEHQKLMGIPNRQSPYQPLGDLQLPPFTDYATKGHTYRYFNGEALYPARRQVSGFGPPRKARSS